MCIRDSPNHALLWEFNKIADIDPALAEKFDAACESISRYRTALVAYSGGTDSSLLAYLSSRLLDRCLCVLWDSWLVQRSDINAAKGFANEHDLELMILDYEVLDYASFQKNARDRCFICKNRLLEALNEIKDRQGLDVVFEGSNTDDLEDFRPGRKAVEQNKVKSPLMDAGLSKDDIRRISKYLGLETWDRPQNACLASRVPWGTDITVDMLATIEKAEEIVKAQGYRLVRVRHHGDLAKIEIGKDEDIDKETFRLIESKIKGLGFKYVVLDMEGYRTGSLNEPG